MPNLSAFKEIYDWFYRTYGETSRERLLELMKNAVGIQHLKQLSQPDLAEFYCEGLAYSAMGPDRIGNRSIPERGTSRPENATSPASLISKAELWSPPANGGEIFGLQV